MSSSRNHLNSELPHQNSTTSQKMTACNPTDSASQLPSASHVTNSHDAPPNHPNKNEKLDADLLVVAGRWRTQKLIAVGGFGHVYQGLDTATGHAVAIKVEQAAPNCFTLHNELAVYEALAADAYPPGFAKMLHFDHLGDRKCALVLERLGKTLENFRAAQPNGRLPMRQAVQAGLHCLHALERLHALGFIHCDVQPANILAGVGRDQERYFLVDFGMARRIGSSDGQQVQSREEQGSVGTRVHASVSVRCGGRRSKTSDVRDLAFSLVWLAGEQVPWGKSGDRNMSNCKQRRAAAQGKREASAEQFSGGWGEGFLDFLAEVRALEYDECPNYEQLRFHLLREESRYT